MPKNKALAAAMRLTGLVIEDMDDNGKDDLLVMILDGEYPAFYGYGRVWFYMNDDAPYCFDEEVFFESENIFEPSERRCVGSNVKGYYDLRPVKYHGKNALQASEYLSGEGGTVHNVATAEFIILWNKNGRPYIDKWWIETSGYTYANDKDSCMREE